MSEKKTEPKTFQKSTEGSFIITHMIQSLFYKPENIKYSYDCIKQLVDFLV